MLRVVLQDFSEDADIRADLVNLHKPAAKGATEGAAEPEDPLAYALR